MRWSPQIRQLEWLTARPIAHRGLHNRDTGVIENTASAFAAAIACNYAIECDLQLAADGEAVVFHDETLGRLTLKSGLLNRHSATELKKAAFKETADRIQTLGELLDQVGGRVPLLIELKSHWDADRRLAQRALGALEHYQGPYALMSFDPDLIQYVRELSPGTVRGVVADRATHRAYGLLPFARRIELRSLSHGPRTRPHFLSFRWQDLPFEPIGRFREKGWPVITWTIRSPEQASAALRFSDQITFEGFKA